MICSQFSEKRQLIQWEGIGYLVNKMVATIFRKSFSYIERKVSSKHQFSGAVLVSGRVSCFFM